MEINRIGNVNIPNTANAGETIKDTRHAETKKVDASSSQALSSQGEAFVNMSSHKSLPELKNLSDSEFEFMKTDLDRYPTPNKERMCLDKTTIQLAEKLIKNPTFYNNDRLKPNIYKLVNNTACDRNKEESTRAKIAMADKILSDERLHENENIRHFICPMIDHSNSEERFIAKSSVLDKILSDERLHDDKGIKSEMYSIVRETRTKKDAEAKINIIDKILSPDEDLYNNKNVRSQLTNIVALTNKLNFPIVNAILSNAKLYDDEITMMGLQDLFMFANTPERVNLVMHNINEVLNE